MDMETNYISLCKVKSLNDFITLEKLLRNNNIIVLAEGSDNFGYIVEVRECEYDKANKIIGDGSPFGPVPAI